jgi:hypothetical protein
MKVDLGDNVKIKTCPLCRAKAFLHTNDDGLRNLSGRHVQFWPKCDNLDCGCTINAAKDQQTALDRWNQRW